MASSGKLTVAQLISRHIDMMSPRRNMREISQRMGFRKPNMLSMIRTGRAAVPFEKIPVIARELEIDPALLLRMHLNEVWPGFAKVVEEVFGAIITDCERRWLAFLGDICVIAPPDDLAVRTKVIELLSARGSKGGAA